jgi:hypothetical protein
VRPVPSAEGVSHEFMRYKTPDARKSLNPTLEREDFKRSVHPLQVCTAGILMKVFGKMIEVNTSELAVQQGIGRID